MKDCPRPFGPRGFVAVAAALFVVLLLCALPATAQPPQTTSGEAYRIAYSLAMPQPASHLFEVRIDVDGVSTDGSVEFQMPRWSPGRYGVFEFAKNVQEVAATSGCIAPQTECRRTSLRVMRADTQTWRVSTASATSVTFSYKVFADDLSGTFSQLDARHANFNGASVFMYVVGHKPDPVTLRIDAPTGWRIVNGYTTRPDQREWSFPNYDVLIDTPTEIAPDWTMKEFKVDSKTYRVVVHAFGDDGGKRDALARDIEKIVRAEVAMWGAPDFESYTFIIHFDPTAREGDGMEHLNSTQIIHPAALADEDAAAAALDTAAHEFFHVWNIKRLRPVELGPWDFTRPVSTRGLWIGEGITNYYGHLMQRRAGIWDDRQFYDNLGETIATVENSPGSRLMSAEQASLLAPFIDGARHEQRTNLDNTSISYYPKGEVVGLALDLLIRGRSRGRASLDDVMRRMYEEFYVKSPNATYYLRGRGYTNEDFERIASEVAGTPLADFFDRYARRAEPPPYDEAFAHVGLLLVRRPDRAPHTAGIVIDDADAQSVTIRSIRTGSAAERAGLKQGDVLITIGKTYVTTASWLAALNIFKRGERVPLSFRRARQTLNATLTLDAPDRFVYRLEEIKDAAPEARALRAAWLKGQG